MTTPEMEEVVERLEALADSIRDRDEGMFTIRSIRADQVMLDLRALLSERRKMVEALEKIASGYGACDGFQDAQNIAAAALTGSREQEADNAR